MDLEVRSPFWVRAQFELSPLRQCAHELVEARQRGLCAWDLVDVCRAAIAIDDSDQKLRQFGVGSSHVLTMRREPIVAALNLQKGMAEHRLEELAGMQHPVPNGVGRAVDHQAHPIERPLVREEAEEPYLLKIEVGDNLLDLVASRPLHCFPPCAALGSSNEWRNQPGLPLSPRAPAAPRPVRSL